MVFYVDDTVTRLKINIAAVASLTFMNYQYVCTTKHTRTPTMKRRKNKKFGSSIPYLFGENP